MPVRVIVPDVPFLGKKSILDPLLLHEPVARDIFRIFDFPQYQIGNLYMIVLDIEVDGGINLETAPLAVKAGADVLVAGNVLFSAPDMAARLAELRTLTQTL